MPSAHSYAFYRKLFLFLSVILFYFVKTTFFISFYRFLPEERPIKIVKKEVVYTFLKKFDLFLKVCYNIGNNSYRFLSERLAGVAKW